MHKILRALSEGTLGPSPTYNPESEYGRATEDSNRKMDALQDALDSAQRSILEDYTDALMKAQWISEQETFARGFLIGARLIFEILQEE